MSKKELEAFDPNARPDFMPAEVGEGGPKGHDMGIDDVAIPRIDLLQDLSPETMKRKEEYVQGAMPGTFLNSVTKKLYGDSFEFIPVDFRLNFFVWRKRDLGGGLVGIFDTQEEAREVLDEECDIVPTHQHFILTVDGLDFAVLSMSRSKLGVSKQLNSLVGMTGKDRFEVVYRLSSQSVSNRMNQEYWNIKVKQLRYTDKTQYEAAMNLYDRIRSDEAMKVDDHYSPYGE